MLYRKYFQLIILLTFLSCTKENPTATSPVEPPDPPIEEPKEWTLTVTNQKQLPNDLEECSGIEINGADNFWMLNDSGNSNKIFGVNSESQLLGALNLVGVTNIDWEDLAQDEDDNLYIGDFGNNDNNRQDLAIYRVPPSAQVLHTSYAPQAIYFSFEDQQSFPPASVYRFFDTEAFFVFNNTIYLFTKDRSIPFKGWTTLYKIPATIGTHTAQLIGSFDTSTDQLKGAITSADINDSASMMVLLSNQQLWLFTAFTGDDFFNGEVDVFPLEQSLQFEAISFKDDNTLYLTNEKNSNGNAQLMELLLEKK